MEIMKKRFRIISTLIMMSIAWVSPKTQLQTYFS